MIGWSGTWRADFRYLESEKATRCTLRSVNRLQTYLKPGEKIRTALFVTAPYTVWNENYAVNYWRSWFLRCNLPKADCTGTPLAPFSTCCLASDTGLPNTDGSISERYSTWRPSLEKMIAEDVKVDFRRLDAGWYIAPDGRSPDDSVPENDWHSTIGTWTLDPVKWSGCSISSGISGSTLRIGTRILKPIRWTAVIRTKTVICGSRSFCPDSAGKTV